VEGDHGMSWQRQAPPSEQVTTNATVCGGHAPFVAVDSVLALAIVHGAPKGEVVQRTFSRRTFVTALGMLSVPLIALAQDNKRDDKDREEKEEKKEEAKDKAEDKKEEAKDKAEDKVDDRDKVVDAPGSDRSQDRRQDRRRDPN
jgi:mannitol-specific phosphotransferase system IIBC component